MDSKRNSLVTLSLDHTAIESRKLWTFIITGGSSFKMGVDDNPNLEHENSTLTIWKMIGTGEEKKFVVLEIQKFGCKVEVHDPDSSKPLKERDGIWDPNF